MDSGDYDIGVIGLGVMGRNLALNMADHGYSVAGFDKDAAKVQALREEKGSRALLGAEKLDEFFRALRRPRSVMMLVPAGPPVDSVIREVSSYLKPGDLLMDAGNSYFEDTDLRGGLLEERGIHFMGVGVSGGELGARNGPSIMPGGSADAYRRMQPIFEAIAAKVNGEACVANLGPGSAGHYVKMIHNGIEYGLMQLIAESYDLMRRGLGMTDEQMHAVYKRWNGGELNSYLVEITARVLAKRDEISGASLVEVIKDAARQKGTGLWSSEDALRLQVPAPIIDLAVSMRDLSSQREERNAAMQALSGPVPSLDIGEEAFLNHLQGALYGGMVLAFAQGMAVLQRASRAHSYQLDLAEVARIWRGGCIIRSAILEKIAAAFRIRPDLANLLLDPNLGNEIVERQGDLRAVIQAATGAGIPVPALMVALAYFDAYRSPRLPANLIQAQRDYFGAHSYERTDMEGVFHTRWDQPQEGLADAA